MRDEIRDMIKGIAKLKEDQAASPFPHNFDGAIKTQMIRLRKLFKLHEQLQVLQLKHDAVVPKEPPDPPEQDPLDPLDRDDVVDNALPPLQ